MKNLKELLVFRIEQALDEGLAKHIAITSDFLADKLIASFKKVLKLIQSVCVYNRLIIKII